MKHFFDIGCIFLRKREMIDVRKYISVFLTYMEVCYESIKLCGSYNCHLGAINWGLIGFFDFNLVSGIFGDATAFTRVIYALVGLSGLYMISLYGRACADA